jgi:hypothetical protein
VNATLDHFNVPTREKSEVLGFVERHRQIEKRRIEVGDIERVEMRPDSIHSSVTIHCDTSLGPRRVLDAGSGGNRRSPKRSLIRAASLLLCGDEAIE